jgi:hypothetical protein
MDAPYLRVGTCTLAAVAVCVFFARLAAQNVPGDSQPSQALGTVYEDDQMKVVVPASWTVSTSDPAVKSPSHPGRNVQLFRDGYTLALTYQSAPPTGKPGLASESGGFGQVFAVSWLTPAQTDGCGFSLRRSQNPISQSMFFIGFWMDTANAGVRKSCGIPADVGPRWFGGFFTIPNGGYFLQFRGDGCAQMTYTLIPKAGAAAELPALADPALKEIAQEAGRIVSTIQYKRCTPAAGPRPANLY